MGGAEETIAFYRAVSNNIYSDFYRTSLEQKSKFVLTKKEKRNVREKTKIKANFLFCQKNLILNPKIKPVKKKKNSVIGYKRLMKYFHIGRFIALIKKKKKKKNLFFTFHYGNAQNKNNEKNPSYIRNI